MNEPGKPEVTLEMREHANTVLHIVAQQLAMYEGRTQRRRDYLEACSDMLRSAHRMREALARERTEKAEKAAVFHDVAREEWGQGRVTAELEAILGGLTSGSNASAGDQGEGPK